MYRFFIGYFVAAAFIVPISAQFVHAQASVGLEDIDGDGTVQVVAFGDSITRGVGDFVAAGEEIQVISGIPSGEAGYPLRLETLLNIPVLNRGFPGERLHSAGVFRFAQTLQSAPADYVVISEGANDAFSRVSTGDIEWDIQAMINMARAMGKEPILMTIPPPCCRHEGLFESTDAYSKVFRSLASLNDVRLADAEQAYRQTCDIDECFLLNLPEGLHPNSSGYDVLGEVVASALLGIDLLAPGGSTLLAQALNVPPSSIVTVSQAPMTPVQQ